MRMRLLRSFALTSGFVCGVLVAASGATADVLVGAPIPNNFASWDTQLGIPPSGPVFFFADQFSLSSDQFVTTIGVQFFGATGIPSTAFNVSLVMSLDSLSPLNSFDRTLLPGSASFDLPINAVIPAGTYFVRLTTAGFVGWPVADETKFVTTAGTLADGIWERIPSSGVWTFVGPGTFAGSHPGVFSVNGPAAQGPVPEPGTVVLIGSGLVGLAAIPWRKRPAYRRSDASDVPS